MTDQPRIAVIGRGEVGITLARRLVQAGWSVQFGSRNPEEVNETLYSLFYSFFYFFYLIRPNYNLLDSCKK